MSQRTRHFFSGLFSRNEHFVEPRIDEVPQPSGVSSWREPSDARWAALMVAAVLAVWAVTLVMAGMTR